MIIGGKTSHLDIFPIELTEGLKIVPVKQLKRFRRNKTPRYRIYYMGINLGIAETWTTPRWDLGNEPLVCSAVINLLDGTKTLIPINHTPSVVSKQTVDNMFRIKTERGLK